ncbi:MAG: Wzy polymerase domain-containing protein [Rhodoferax sp.]|nr:Wzy polymerase domain-containing protein [Rhodoferax sp.]
MAIVVVALPWLWPIAIGPWPAALPWLVSLMCGAVIVLLGIWTRMDWPNAAAAAWLVAAAISSGIGLLQYFGWSSALAPFVNTTPIGEAFANLRQRNQFATLTNIGLATLFLSSVHRNFGIMRLPSSWRASDGQPGWAVVGVATLMAVGNAASSSRTGMVQLGLILILLAVWGYWRQAATRTLALTVLLAYGSAALILPRLAGLDPSASGILARLQDGGPACSSRWTLWGNVWQLVIDKPWWGWGWGELDFAHFMRLYSGPRFCDILDNAHNLPLHLAVELGLPVALCACGLGLWMVWRARPWREASPVRQMAWAVLALILLHSMLEYPLWYGPFQMAALVCTWLLLTTRGGISVSETGAARPPDSAQPQVGGLVTRIVIGTLAFMVICLVAYAAWDYQRVSQIYLAPERRMSGYKDNTLEKIRGSRLFANQVRFAELSTVELTLENAAYVNSLAKDLLHFSPETRVVEKLIESALLLGRASEAREYLIRYKAAFPTDFARWASLHGIEPRLSPAPAAHGPP